MQFRLPFKALMNYFGTSGTGSAGAGPRIVKGSLFFRAKVCSIFGTDARWARFSPGSIAVQLRSLCINILWSDTARVPAATCRPMLCVRLSDSLPLPDVRWLDPNSTTSLLDQMIHNSRASLKLVCHLTRTGISTYLRYAQTNLSFVSIGSCECCLEFITGI